MIGSSRFRRNRTDDEPEQRFISAEDFATATGLSLEQVINQYSVLRDGEDVVPHFIADDWTAETELHSNQISTEDHDVGTSSVPVKLDDSFDDEFSTSDHTQESTAVGISEEPQRSFETSDNEDAKLEYDIPETDINEKFDNHRLEPFAELDTSIQEPHHTNASVDVSSITDKVNIHPETADDPIDRIRLRLKKMGGQFRADPGIRFWARFIDLMPLYGLLCIGSQIAVSRITSSESIPNPAQVAAILFLLFPAVFLLDSLIYAVFGNTIGKSIAGVRVIDENGDKLTFGKYLVRDFSLWLQGLAMLLPPLFLISLFVQYLRVRRDRPSTYDRNSGVNVLQDATGALQKFGFALFVVGSFLAMILIVDSIGSYFFKALQSSV